MYQDEWSTDYKGRCGNCHELISDGEKYCRYCGTKRGEGKFKPYLNMIQCIYGPAPVKRKHICKVCNNTWERELMIDDECYCPQCGNKVEIIESDWRDDWNTPAYSPANTLTLHTSDITLSFYPDYQPRIILGRDKSADFHVQDPMVSRLHALIVFEDFDWYLQDNGALNGTFLNGERLCEFTKTKLSHNDEIILAKDIVITVRIGE